MNSLGMYFLFFLMTCGDVELTEAEQEWIYLAGIMREQTSHIDDPAYKLKSMTDWLHENVKHVRGGKYPRTFNRKSLATVIQSGVGNCGYQSYNICGFAQMLGYNNHRILHHRKQKGAPADHTFAEIEVNGQWIVFDPDKFQYFEDESGELLSVEQIATDTSSWIGISERNQGYIETRSSKPCPRTRFDYYDFERSGMPYVLLLCKSAILEEQMILEGHISSK